MESSSDLTQNNAPRRIHLLGVGSIGVLIAHSLAGIPNPPPMTLLVHRPEHLQTWRDRGEKINLVVHGVPEERGDFDMELVGSEAVGSQPYSEAEPVSENGDEKDGVIYNLIVTVKSHLTVAALKPVAHRLKRESTILFVQNGMGAVDEVNEKLFPDLETRPSYMQGVISHGVYVTEKFSAVHAGLGTIALGSLRREPFKPGSTDKPASEPESLPPTSKYLMNTVVRTPALAAVAFPYADLLQLQLEKLAVNCVLNPLTGVLDCRNGEILYNFNLSRVFRLLLAEISLVIRSLPELQGVPNVRMRFSPERLETLVVGVTAKTAKNFSSMLQDVRAGTITEVEYINGYIVRRGEELGIKCALNYMLLHMVVGKQRIIDRSLKGILPVEMLDGEKANDQS
jgi:2-dehydropantoate 2-reductase